MWRAPLPSDWLISARSRRRSLGRLVVATAAASLYRIAARCRSRRIGRSESARAPCTIATSSTTRRHHDSATLLDFSPLQRTTVVVDRANGTLRRPPTSRSFLRLETCRAKLAICARLSPAVIVRPLLCSQRARTTPQQQQRQQQRQQQQRQQQQPPPPPLQPPSRWPPSHRCPRCMCRRCRRRRRQPRWQRCRSRRAPTTRERPSPSTISWASERRPR